MAMNVKMLLAILLLSVGCRPLTNAKLQGESDEQSLIQMAEDAPLTRSMRIFNDQEGVRILQLTFGKGEPNKAQVASALKNLADIYRSHKPVDFVPLNAAVLTDTFCSGVQDIFDEFVMRPPGPLTSSIARVDLADSANGALASLQAILQRLANGETLNKAEAEEPVRRYLALMKQDQEEMKSWTRGFLYLLPPSGLRSLTSYRSSNASLLTDIIHAANTLKQINANGAYQEYVARENVSNALYLKQLVFIAKAQVAAGNDLGAASSLMHASSYVDSIRSRSGSRDKADVNLIETILNRKTNQASYHQYILNFGYRDDPTLLAFRSSQAPTDAVGDVAADRGWTFKLGQKQTWREWLSWKFNRRIPREAQLSRSKYLTLVKFIAAVNDIDDPRNKPLIDYLSSTLRRGPSEAPSDATASPTDVEDRSVDVADAPILDHIDIDGAEYPDTANLPDDAAWSPEEASDAAAAGTDEPPANGDSSDGAAASSPADADDAHAGPAQPTDARR